MIDVLIIKKEERDNNRAPPANKSLVIEIATERKALLAMTNKVRSACLSVCACCVPLF
jgi:hypothetical protein